LECEVATKISTLTMNDGGLLAQLPVELLLNKLVLPFLTVRDVLALQSTCRYLYHSIGLVPLNPSRRIFPRTIDHVRNIVDPEEGLNGAEMDPPPEEDMQTPSEPLRFPGDYQNGDLPQPLYRLRPVFSSSGTRGQIHSCQLHFTWVDQGWGNRKGMAYVVERLPQHGHSADGADGDARNAQESDILFGGKIIGHTATFAEHEVTSTSISFQVRPCDSVEYYMFFSAGGGGGHVLMFHEISLRTWILDASSSLAPGTATTTTQRPLSRSYQILSSAGAIPPLHPERVIVGPESVADEGFMWEVRPHFNHPHLGSCSGVIYPNGRLTYPLPADRSTGPLAALPRDTPLRSSFSVKLLSQVCRSLRTQRSPDRSLAEVLKQHGIGDNVIASTDLLLAMETVLLSECEEQWSLEQELMDRREQRRRELLARPRQPQMANAALPAEDEMDGDGDSLDEMDGDGDF
jgi:hypothetical protein